MRRLPRPVRRELTERQQGPSAGGPVACRAPFVSLSLQTSGDVYACCRKPAHLLGNITTEGLADIWGNATARALRRSMRRFAFPEGCSVCEWYVRAGATASADLRSYEHLGFEDRAPAFPRRLEFNLANTCNLECIHCSGELSSRIRARRERLPPLPRVYGDRFFDDLDAFLPHLDDAVFLGGEPFLQAECHRVWSRLIALGRPVPCSITTSGVVCNDRVLDVLAALPVNLSVSLDAARRETFERVRRGASWDRVTANLDLFQEHVGPRGSVRLTFSVLADNWLELPEFLLLAERRGIDVWLNRVTHPQHLSLRALPRSQLQDGLERLERTSDRLVPHLRRNEAIWWQFLTIVRGHAGEGGLEDLGRRFAASSVAGSDLRLALEAKRHLERGDDRRALGVTLPDDAGAGARRELFRWQTEAHRRLGELDDALAMVEAWSRLSPADWQVHTARAHLLLATAGVEAALPELALALERFIPGEDPSALRAVARDLQTACPVPVPDRVDALLNGVASLRPAARRPRSAPADQARTAPSVAVGLRPGIGSPPDR